MGIQPIYHNLRHIIHCAKGKKRQREFIYQFFSCITGIGAIMLLIIFLGLIINSALLSGACDFGSPNLNDFDWAKVGIRVLKLLL